ncbi:hypothetical protein MBLNU13_g10999t1 [Cladosporium sp. NU13]
MAFTYWPGACDITYTHSAEPLTLPTKSGPSRALPSLIEDSVPPCNLNPFLPNGHLQTFWTAMKFDGPPIHYKRRTFAASQDSFAGHFTVDFVTAAPPPASSERDAEGHIAHDAGLTDDPVGVGHHYLPPRTTYFSDAAFDALGADDDKPLLICLHGLSGGSYETYLRHVLAPLVAETPAGAKAGGLSGGEWEALVVNSRGCAGSKITNSMLYNARATWDVRQTVKWAREKWPRRRMFGVGFSLGANILTTVGEEGDKCLLSAALIISNPWKLEVASLSLQRSWLGMNVYSKAMGKSMRGLFDLHAEQVTLNKAITTEKMHSIKYLHEFDREFQCATWGYPTEGAYYRDATSADSVFAIRIPTMCLHAKDDPIACDEAVPYEEIKQTPYVVMCATSGGGHLSWFEFGGNRWHSKPAVNFLNAMAREVDFDKLELPKMPFKGPHGGHQSPFAFDPMRRKAYVFDSDQ